MRTDLTSRAARHRSTRVALLLATATLATAALTACTGSADHRGHGEEPAAPTIAAPMPAPAEIDATGAADVDVATLAALVPASGDEMLPSLAATSRAAADELLARTGIASLLPSAALALAAAEADLGRDAASAIEADDGAPAAGAPAASAPATGGMPGGSGAGSPGRQSTGRGAPAPLSTQGAALGVSTLAVALDSVMRETADGTPMSADQTVDHGPVHADMPTAQARVVDGRVDLRLVQRGTESTEGGQVHVELDLRGGLDACPTADGTVTGSLSIDVRIVAATGAATAGGRYTMQIDLTASVDDRAMLAGHTLDVSGSASETARSSPDGGATVTGWFVEGGSRTTLTGNPGAGTLQIQDVDGVEITRSSSGADQAAVTTFLEQQAAIAAKLTSYILASAEAHWRGGACVDVHLPTAGDPTQVAPGAELLVGIEATAADGQPIGAPATATATGTGGLVLPDGTTQPLPAEITYVVPSDGADGTITAEVTSRRGIGRATLVITAAPAFVVDGALDVFHATGTKCGGIGGEWELALQASFEGFPFAGTLRFELDPVTWSGSYTLTGTTSGGGMTIQQSGSGTVVAQPGPDGPQLAFTGNVWTGGPVDTFAVPARRVAAGGAGGPC